MGIWGCRVVVVDDDTDTVAILSRLLRDRGADVVDVAQSGAALATILGVLPDFVIVDADTRGLDCIGLIRKLRSLSPERGGRIPATTLSARATADDLATWRVAGFQAHIDKPFEETAVLSLAADLAGQWVERRRAALARREWPAERERRSDRRGQAAPILQGIAGGNETLVREMPAEI